MTTRNRKVASLSDEEKATALKEIGRRLDPLERAHGADVVRWAVNRRHAQRVERARLKKERKALEARLAEIDSGG